MGGHDLIGDDREAERGAAPLEKFGPGAVGIGWDLAFHGLAQHLAAAGAALDRDAAEAWMRSSEGKAAAPLKALRRGTLVATMPPTLSILDEMLVDSRSPHLDFEQERTWGEARWQRCSPAP